VTKQDPYKDFDWGKYWGGPCPHGYSARRACQRCKASHLKNSNPDNRNGTSGRSPWEDR
jgi:hypothetical protein